MLRSRSLAPFGPPLDRLVLRAALARGAAWPRSSQALCAVIAQTAGRDPAECRFVADPEAALILAVLERLAAAGRPRRLAVPAWGAAGLVAAVAAQQVELRFMDPARQRLDPGPSDVAAALDQGALAVILSPVGGDCAGLHEIAELCARRGVLLALDARAAAGGRVRDRGPDALGDLTLLSVDGEPGPSPCPGAILAQRRAPASAAGSPAAAPAKAPPPPSRETGRPADGGDDALGRSLPSGPLWAALLRDSLRSEPRLRWFARPRVERRSESPTHGAPPPWACAAAAARLAQSAERASMRARHARALRSNIANVHGITVADDPPGVQSAGGHLPVRIEQRDAVLAALVVAGVPALGPETAWFAAPGARSARACAAADEALFLPLLPFYRPRDLVFLGEALRRAALSAVPPEPVKR